MVVVLSLLVVGLSGFIVYDKLFNDNNTVVDNNDDTISDESNQNDYKIFAERLKSEFSKYDSNNYIYQYVDSDLISDGYEVYLDEKGSLYIKYFDSELNEKFGEYKIADNILNFYIILTGQGGGNTLYFINEDGTVGSANIEYGVSNSNNKILVNNDLGYKNIVTIVSGIFGNEYTGVHGPIFIDINGNVYSDNLK